MAKMDDINIFDYQAPTPEELLAAGSGATVRPLSPFEQMEIERSRPSSDPVIRRLQSIGRGIGSFLVPETPLDVALSGVMAAKPIVAAGKAASKGIQALPKDKDLVFVHNTSEEAIKSFDQMGGIPSPSIAVTKSDQPFTGFGTIQLIGKPEKFDPLVDPRNKIYSADAYTPRAPQKIRLAKDDAVEQLKKDYKEFIDEGTAGGLEPLGIENLEKLKKGRGAQILNDSSVGFDAFFNNTDVARMKFLKEIGRDLEGWKNKSFPEKRYQEWVRKQKDKYLSQDGVFQYFDEFEQTMKTKPYTLENVVENMVQDTQRGGEAGLGLGMMGANRLRAITSEQFKDLPDIKARKEMLTSQLDDGSATLFDIEEKVAKALGKIDDDEFIEEGGVEYVGEALEGIGSYLKEGRSIDDAVQTVFNNTYPFKNYLIPTEVMDDVANTIRLNAMRPVQYFEAKPTRAVGFDEFAGAIVPEGTSKEVVDILEKRGLKVVKQSMDEMKEDYGKGKIRQEFKDQFFSIGLPATGAAALSIENTDIFADDTQ